MKGIQNSVVYNTFKNTSREESASGITFTGFQKIIKGKGTLRKPSSHDNIKIIIDKFIDSFLS